MAKSKGPIQSARDQMMGEITEGVREGESIDFSAKSILARGCDPQMALRASKMMPSLLGGVELVSCTDDEDFIAKLQARTWSVVFFAPGACRYNAANRPIPGASSHTSGWGLAEYRVLVRRHQGEDIQIVETTKEREIIPLLKRALLQSRDSSHDDTGASHMTPPLPSKNTR
jgi:hypothetical protein